jgi:ubiquinone/menaquinone biosynthesis C-methylase UbiE
MESQGIQSLWSKDPGASEIFRAVMGTAPAEDYMPIVRSWDFAGRNVVADLGGGGGALISAVLQSYPEISGMLVDRPDSIERAALRFQAEGLADRCRLIAADLGDHVPAGADVYMMKHVLHGCRDDAAIKILLNCRAVIQPDGRLLVVEFVLPDVISEKEPTLEKRLMSDLNMMAVTGGKERSATEWKTLLERSGFDLLGIIPVHEPNGVLQEVSVVEARPSAS